MNSKDLKQRAREYGADLIGISPAERFSELAPDKNPLSIFPQCKSVIIIARRILRGSLRGVEEGTNFGSTYNAFGFSYLEDNFLSKTTYDLTCFIEENGGEAVPVFNYNPEGMPKGVAVSKEKPEPNVLIDFDVAVQAAGLGEVGLGGFIITPEFGTRQRFAAILTDIELDPDDIHEKSICSDCKACVEACPLGAYDLNKTVKRGLPGHETEVVEIDYSVCAKCQNGALLWPGRGTRPDRIASACGRACLVQLEGANKCANKFQNNFRKRKPWALDIMSRPAESSMPKVGCDGAVSK